jgi:periodic tryptophan protein 2
MRLEVRPALSLEVELVGVPLLLGAAGADDCKVKLFQLSSGFCYVTFSDHSAPVTALAFLPTGAAVVSASLDGTVRAFDLLRYR